MSREKFEAHCVEQLKAARIVAAGAGGHLDGDNGEAPTVENLCWTLRDGSYGVRMIQSAWVGYQWAMADMQVAQGESQELECDFT